MIFYSFDYFRNVKSKLFSSCAAALLVVLMLFKISASFHAYTHQDNTSDVIENCAICDVAIENQQTEFIATAPQSVAAILFNIDSKEQTTFSSDVPLSFDLLSKYFGRPPPTLV